MAKPTDPTDNARALHLPAYLNRVVPYWGHPGWLMAERWRSFVRNQALCLVCRDTLIQNVLSTPWDVVAKDPGDKQSPSLKKSIDRIKKVLEDAEGDFDTFCELVLQDMLDIPFGGAFEVGREDDSPDGDVLWIEHIDGATLLPTGDPDDPVEQRVKQMPTRTVRFPKYAIERLYVTPRPEIDRKGWGMAPPEKAYLAIEMLFRGDRYYANLLLDTPEAGILDLIDMEEQDAEDWIANAKALFTGIDGFKVPVLYQHTKPAVWIPFNRPPTDLLYDKTTIKYAQILAAAYGMRLSDIGMEDMGGEKTLAGVIRGERQSRRSGQALVRTKLENAMDRVVGDKLKFIWKIDDDEVTLGKGRAVMTYVQGLTAAKEAGFIDAAEGRRELVATGVLKVEIDPEALPPPPAMPGAIDPATGLPIMPPNPLEAAASGTSSAELGGVPVSQGGRGDSGLLTQRGIAGTRTTEQLQAEMARIIKPALTLVVERAEEPRLRRLVRAVTTAMVPKVERTFLDLTDEQIEETWLPEMLAFDFDEPNEVENAVLRSEADELRVEVEKHLADDPWWRTATDARKDEIMVVMRAAAEAGAVNAGYAIVHALYEAGQRRDYAMTGYSFNLRNRATIALLEERAANLVRWVDEATKTFIRRVVVAGVRQGLSSPEIAQAIRDGATAEHILQVDGFIGDVTKLIREGLVEMSEARSNSIVNTEIAHAETTGRLVQFKMSGLTTKAWVHRGKRGVTAKGNVHPCPLCAGNEAMGFVPIDFAYPTVFRNEPSPVPPAHPSVCHCDIMFNEAELLAKVGTNEYRPWNGR